jgi:predicted RNA-binding Zn ribbon-like protein
VFLRKMPSRSSAIRNLELCVNFSNTKDWHGSDHPIEKLHNYSDLIQWSLEQGTLDNETFKTLLKRSKLQEKKAETVLENARDLRESIYRVFSAVSQDRSPKSKDFDTVGRYFSKAMLNLKLVTQKQKKKNRFYLQWKYEKNDFDEILWPIAKSAADLLISEKLEFVKECANEKEGCGWLFIDMSKNHSRKWCAMSACGNRNKVRSYYKRKKGI